MLLVSYLFVVFFFMAFVTDCLPFVVGIKNISQLALKAVEIIQSTQIDDSKKEKLLLANSFSMFKQSFKILLFVVIIALAGFLLVLLSVSFNAINYKALLCYMITFNGILIPVISFISYFILKKLYVKIRL